MIVVSDLEGTLSAGATWRGFGRYIKEHRSALRYNLFFAIRLPGMMLVQMGLINRRDFQNRWFVDMIKLLTDATPESVAHMAEWVVEHELWPGRREDVLAEMAQHREARARIIVASGIYQPIAEAFARRFGAEAAATPLEITDGRARVVGEISVREVKVERVQATLGGQEVDIAYGDSGADVPMMELGKVQVAVYPDRALRRIAEARGWRILEGGRA